MFWHEESENENNLLPFSKSNYLNKINPKKKEGDGDDSQKDNILDLSDSFKIGMIISSDWGPGKVVSVEKATGKVVLEIEGSEKEFDIFELRPFLQVYIHVYFKDLELKDKRIILSANLLMSDTIGKIKKTIAGMFNTDEKNVIIVHKGEKITNNNKKVSECGLFVLDNLLVVINGTCLY